MLRRNIASMAALAAVLAVAAATPALAAGGSVSTGDRGDHGGHATYKTSTVRDPDGGTRTSVAFSACDDDADGYGIVALLDANGRGLGFASDRNGANDRCGPRKILSGKGAIYLRVCRHDKDRSEKGSSPQRQDCNRERIA